MKKQFSSHHEGFHYLFKLFCILLTFFSYANDDDDDLRLKRQLKTLRKFYIVRDVYFMWRYFASLHCVVNSFNFLLFFFSCTSYIHTWEMQKIKLNFFHKTMKLSSLLLFLLWTRFLVQKQQLNTINNCTCFYILFSLRSLAQIIAS